MTGHFTSYINRTDHELATPFRMPIDKRLRRAEVCIVEVVTPTIGSRQALPEPSLEAEGCQSTPSVHEISARSCGSLAATGAAGSACIARNVIPRVRPPVYCVQYARRDGNMPANAVCTH